MSSKSLIKPVIFIFLIGALMLPLLAFAQMQSNDLVSSVDAFGIISKIMGGLRGVITSFFADVTGAGLGIVSSIANLSTAFIVGNSDDSLDESPDEAPLSDFPPEADQPLAGTIDPRIIQEDSRPEETTNDPGDSRRLSAPRSDMRADVPLAPKIITISKEDTIEQEIKDSVKEEAAIQESEQANEETEKNLDAEAESDSVEAEHSENTEIDNQESDDAILIQEPIVRKFDLPPPRGAPSPPLISIQNDTTFNAVSDTNGEEDGNQIILSGTAEPWSLITIRINPTYTATTTLKGVWSKEVMLPYEGANNFAITAANYVGEGNPFNLVINLDTIAPTTTIAVANYSIDSDKFQIQWSSEAEDTDYYEVQYKIGTAAEWQDWTTGKGKNKNYQNATTGTYYFQARAIDIHQNIGQWQEISVVIDLYRVVINEIQTNDAEFVELYNPTSNQISLKGYYFSYYPSTRVSWNGTSTPNGPSSNQSFPNNAKIPANGYFLIGLDGYPDSGGNPDSDWQVYASKQLSDSAGTVGIFPFDLTSATTSQYAYDNRVDAIGWGSGISLYETNSATTTPVAGESLTRDSSHTDIDDNSVDFTVATSTTPTNSAGETYVPPPPPPPPGQDDFLIVSTTTAAIDDADNTEVVGITVENTTTTAIVIDKITVSWIGAPGGTKIEEITIDGGSLWSGKGNSGSLLDVIDFTLTAGAGTYSINSLDFSKNMTGTTIDITFIMGDGTTKTVSSIQP